MRTLIQDLEVGKDVKLYGWLHEIRDLAKVKFLLLRDRTGIIQCVVTMEKEDMFNLVPKLKQETAVQINGKVVENKIAKLGYEVDVSGIIVLGEVNQTLPVQVVEKGDINTDLSTRLDYRFLDLRRPKIAQIFKVRNEIYKTTVDFFTKNNFMNVATPKLTSAGVESGAEMFSLKYFETTAYLSQSPQIYKQMLVCSGFERVYEIAPVFRAEKSNTTRHQTEFTGIDFEMAFVKDENELMDFTEKYMRALVESLNNNCSDVLKEYDTEIQLPNKIPRMTMEEIKKILEENKKEISDELDPEAEEILGKIVKEKHNSDFVFITNYPWKKRPFYHLKDGLGTKSFDLLFKGVEIATGSMREHNYEKLLEQAKEKGVNLEEMKDYEILFNFGAPPHGGCGLGLDRITQKFLSLDNVREAVFLPRDPDRLTP